MKKIILIVLFFINVFSAYCQQREKEPHYNYISLGTSVFTNTAGTFNQKLFLTAEFGRTFGIFDIGVVTGRLNLVNAKNGIDSNWFVEILPTINVFSKGRFSEAFTLGAGRIFNRKENFLTEITNSINFAPNNTTIITVYFGNYFFDGKLSTSRAQFMGLSVTCNLIKKNTKTDTLRKKSLLNN